MFVYLTGLPAGRLTLYNLYTRHTKDKFSLNKSRPTIRGGMECWVTFLTWTFGTTEKAELSAIPAGRTLPLKKFLGTQF
jgi:hypothetical protein